MAENNKESIISSLKNQFHQFLRSYFREPDSMKHEEQSALFSVFAFLGYETVDDVSESLVSDLADDIADGGGDRSIDFCRIDASTGRAFCIQSKLREQWGRDAKTDGARDMNSGMGWLLRSENPFPPDSSLHAKSEELVNMVKNDELNEIHLLFVHNTVNTDDVLAEMEQVRQTALNALKRIKGELFSSDVRVVHRALGAEEIYRCYESQKKTILVDETINFPKNTRYLRPPSGKAWEAAVVSVPCQWVADLHQKHGEDLFNNNFRSYMGAAKGAAGFKVAINRSIRDTVSQSPDNFWAFNNGITALVHQMDFANDGTLTSVQGMSIINGAQTTGALGEALSQKGIADDSSAVLLRLVQCRNHNVVDNIIRCNNTQNTITSEDRWSNDPKQARLADEFQAYGISYVYRRSSSSLALPPRYSLKIAHLGKMLCAFHGDVQTAFRNSSNIFDNGKVYNKNFAEGISATHCILVYALSKAIDNVKSELKNRISANEATKAHKEQYRLMHYSASKHFLLYIAGRMAEDVLGRGILDPFCLIAGQNANKDSLIDAWETFIKGILPSVRGRMDKHAEDENINNPDYTIPRDMKHTKKVAADIKEHFLSNMESTSFHEKIKDLLSLK